MSKVIQTNPTSKKIFLVLLGFLSIILIGVIIILITSKDETKNEALISDSAESDNVLSAQKNVILPVIQSHQYIQQENRFLRVNIKISNNSDFDYQVSPLLQYRAVSNSGEVYPFTSDYTNNPMGGTLLPGSEISGYIDFTVAEEKISKILYSENFEANQPFISLELTQ
jgi:uncharacterized membrane protein YraQ (UPF0718 family)